ncbi:MAG: Hsp20/alpha crystallin family protein [Ignavibacteriales bacterium]|nr:Hsp20/alpha crystallin family protein [Ignavibacteriales bacterium]MCF8306573.1 Hsp20/alpha crystallin family protein [Ignavibacteriales bacterium]MCF8316372.1 Hsp20/alpha crystallin family protein [Ignavibacteriales bacterium]MCF8437670.1 Hsp20/alpha crystallin family protein [Ignavibacteriales bacterium]
MRQINSCYGYTPKNTGNYYGYNYSAPKSDILEDINGFLIQIELPGVKKEEIKLSVEKNILSIAAERKKSAETDTLKYKHSEIAYGTISRSFVLGEIVDSEKIAAEYSDGILKVSIPKKEQSKPKEIIIN